MIKMTPTVPYIYVKGFLSENGIEFLHNQKKKTVYLHDKHYLKINFKSKAR